jgi:hypothetical protein
VVPVWGGSAVEVSTALPIAPIAPKPVRRVKAQLWGRGGRNALRGGQTRVLHVFLADNDPSDKDVFHSYATAFVTRYKARCLGSTLWVRARSCPPR